MSNQYLRSACTCLLIIVLMLELNPNHVSAKESNDNEKITEVNKDEESRIFDINLKEHAEKDSNGVPSVLYEIEEKREENIKYFLLSNQDVQVVVYSNPVHYLENGRWVDIDQSLTEGTSSKNGTGYMSTKNGVVTKIAVSSNSEHVVEVEKDDCELAYSWITEKNNSVSKNTVANRNKEKKVEYDNLFQKNRLSYCEQMDVMTSSDVVSYDDVLPNVDLEEKVINGGTKSSIVIKKKKEKYSYTYQIKTKNLELKLSNNRIEAYRKGSNELVFYMPEPYMVSENGKKSSAVYYSLSYDGESYKLNVTLDPIWINKEECELPVRVQSYIMTENEEKPITSTFIASNWSDTNFSDYHMRVVGQETSTYGICRMLLKWNLPNMEEEVSLKKSVLNLRQNYISCYAKNTLPMEVEAYELASAWDEKNVNWKSKPSMQSDSLLSYNTVSAEGTEQIMSFDVTSASQDWLKGSIENYGIVLKAAVETGKYAEVAVNTHYCSENSYNEENAYPVLTYVFENQKEKETATKVNTKQIKGKEVQRTTKTQKNDILRKERPVFWNNFSSKKLLLYWKNSSLHIKSVKNGTLNKVAYKWYIDTS